MNYFERPIPFPPSLADKPFAVMMVVAGMLVGLLICLRWIYTIVTEVVEDRRPIRHPLSAIRAVKLTLILAALTLVVPRLMLVMVYNLLSAGARESLSLAGWLTYAVWATLLVIAWWIDNTASEVVEFQLRRVPTPEVTTSTSGARTRGILTLGLIFVVAFATTYIRPYRIHAHASLSHRR